MVFAHGVQAHAAGTPAFRRKQQKTQQAGACRAEGKRLEIC